jgi:hypothetical protein
MKKIIRALYSILCSKNTFRTAWGGGATLLSVYLYIFSDFRISLWDIVLYVVLSVTVALLMVKSGIQLRFPSLSRRLSDNEHLLRTCRESNEFSEPQSHYLRRSLASRYFFLSPAEDGLICVPILFAGGGWLACCIGAAVFGMIHLGRFTYFECLGKMIIYFFACILILPNGILNVVLGHLLVNFVCLVLLFFAPSDV